MARTARLLGAWLATVILLAAPARAEVASNAQRASAVLKDASGKEVGRAVFTATPSGALLNLTLTAAQPGVPALHIHAVGRCDPPDFKSAGTDFNPDQTKHGIMNPEGPHAGDLPNIHVPADGKLEVEFLNPVVTISREAALLDADGTSIVIHANADDYKTDPDGNSGPGIACGVITR
ncbi:MAG TPA: superoxide dismutase family protein [Methyloceanibacter sp.]|nr:superoxide dismutase family protein [Methyloceanibacter sp.]